jgi:hypothetical protein
MSHILTSTITHASDEDLRHLETCEKCRSRVVTDVDLGSVRARILSEATTEPRSVRPTKQAVARPWLIGVSAAVAVVVLFLPLMLTNREQPAESPAVSSPDSSTPAVAAGASTFEMTFQGTDGAIGRLIWGGPELYEGLRATRTGDSSNLQYNFHRNSDGAGFYDAAMDPFPKNEEGVPILGAAPEDPSVPWPILLERMSPEEMWTQIGGTGEPIETDPTHPLAISAYVDGDVRLEWDAQGVPVLVDSPVFGSFRVTELTWRDLRPDEIQNNVELPFRYALHLSASTTAEQQPALSDGIVTFSDYRSAVEVAASCAGVEARFDDGTGLFRFEENPRLDGCRARHLNDIEEVWRVDSQQIAEDELTIIWAQIDERPQDVEIYEAEPGPEMTLASGDDWAISIWQRGPGICLRHHNYKEDQSGTSGHGCGLPSEWQIPHILNAQFATAVDGDQPIEGEILGFLTEAADRLVVTFESGDTIEIEPGETFHLGYRGFGLPWYDGTVLGHPETLEVFDGETSLGVYRHAPVPEPESDGS